jgi:hypothetical protein
VQAIGLFLWYLVQVDSAEDSRSPASKLPIPRGTVRHVHNAWSFVGSCVLD